MWSSWNSVTLVLAVLAAAILIGISSAIIANWDQKHPPKSCRPGDADAPGPLGYWVNLVDRR